MRRITTTNQIVRRLAGSILETPRCQFASQRPAGLSQTEIEETVARKVKDSALRPIYLDVQATSPTVSRVLDKSEMYFVDFRIHAC